MLSKWTHNSRFFIGMSSLEKIADILRNGEERERKYETFTEINKRIKLLKEEINRNEAEYVKKQMEWFSLKKKFYELQVDVEAADRRIASLERFRRNIQDECNHEKHYYDETYDTVVAKYQDFFERGNNVLYKIERYNNLARNGTSQISKKVQAKEERKRKLQELRKQGEDEGTKLFEFINKRKLGEIRRCLNLRQWNFLYLLQICLFNHWFCYIRYYY